MSVVIKLKGLPFESTSKDIRSFFQGLHLREDEIHLAAYKDGKASGIAFAVFSNDEDARKAMFRNGEYMGKRYIELFLSSASEMKSMLQYGVPEPRQPRREEETRDQTQGEYQQGQKSSRGGRREPFPRDRSRSPISRQEVKGELSDSRRNRGSSSGGNVGRHFESDRRGESFFEMKLRKDENGRQNRFQRLQNEREISTERNRNLQMEQRDILKEKGYEKEERYDKRESYVRDNHRRLEYMEDRDREDLSEKTCCRLFGLPFQIKESEIRNFFKGYNVVEVKLLYHSGGSFVGKKNGQGYVEFRSARDAKEAAKNKHNQYLGSRYVEVKCCSKKDMIEESTLNDEECQMFKEGRDKKDSRYGTMAGKPISDLAVKIDPKILNPTFGIPSLFDSTLELQNPYIMSLQNPYISAESLELQTLETVKQLAATANINPEDATSGCVVGIRNLPSSITEEEVLDFFYGFAVLQDSVRIHYLVPGRSSGDAMITFRSSREATLAIEQLNHKPVGKRNVQLFLV